jgi:thymidylate synthase (FAD)
VPDVWRRQSPSNKQASLGQVSDEDGQALTASLLEHYARSYEHYEDALKKGVARELARAFLPGFSVYYTWVVKVDCHNMMHFLQLRMAEEAQHEIRVFAQVIYQHFFKPLLPWTAEAFERYVLGEGEE